MKLNSFQLKIFAAVLMLIDHIAVVFLAQSPTIYVIMRAIGRISAPLFWFCFANSMKRTSNYIKLIGRLTIFAIITFCGNVLISNIWIGQPINNIFSHNVFAEFAVIGMAIYFFEELKTSQIIQKVVLIFGFLSMTIVGAIYFSYGALMVFVIYTFYFIKDKKLKTIFLVIGSIAICILQNNWLQIFMLGSLLLINTYHDEKPKHSGKWFFYVFYPTHYWALLILAHLLKG